MPTASTPSMRLESDLSSFLQPMAEVCRRKSRRFQLPVQAPGLLTYLDDKSSEQVWLYDVSEHGVGFCATHRLKVNTQIVLWLKGKNGGPFIWNATVVHATQAGPNDWRIGCNFVACIGPELLNELL